jgi:hypothetical protein
MAAIAFNCPRLRCRALAFRQAAPGCGRCPQPQAPDAARPQAVRPAARSASQAGKAGPPGSSLCGSCLWLHSRSRCGIYASSGFWPRSAARAEEFGMPPKAIAAADHELLQHGRHRAKMTAFGCAGHLEIKNVASFDSEGWPDHHNRNRSTRHRRH